MTKLSAIPQHHMSITCGFCKHHTLLEVANLNAVEVEAPQPMRYVREPDVITAEPKATTPSR